jgi:alpha-L-arabinofuranosidase
LLSSAVAVAANSRVEILLDEPIGRISPNLYGHFAENLGGVIYDGIWVGRDSKIANVGGVRRALIEQMRAIKAPIVRFPGGCFADSYDWRDGIGAPGQRPRRTNFWASQLPPGAPRDQRYDPNQFGTNEFIEFCRATGSQPYLAANVRSLPAEEFGQWVEYCNAPAGSTTLADARGSQGDAAPFDVRYWGVGNEPWGCGGTFTPAEYAEEFCRYAAAVPEFTTPLSLVASGPDKDDWNWTSGFFDAVARRGQDEFGAIFGFALHYYTWNLSRGRTQDFVEGKGDAVDFDAVDWYELLLQGDRMEMLIDRHWQIMGETDRRHVVKLVVDEWGTWYRPGSSPTPTNLFEQTPTLRDAVYSAMTLDTFNRNADKVAMANCAQLVNCLNSLYLAHDDRFCVTPVGHVFAMYADHQGGQAIRAIFEAPKVAYERDGSAASFWGLNGSASLHGKTVVLTVTNPHVTLAREATVRIRGANVTNATMSVLTHNDMHAHNSFEDPQTVIPAATTAAVSGSEVTATFPPASVAKLTLQLA